MQTLQYKVNMKLTFPLVTLHQMPNHQLPKFYLQSKSTHVHNVHGLTQAVVSRYHLYHHCNIEQLYFEGMGLDRQ